jgi:hypothetical protein
MSQKNSKSDLKSIPSLSASPDRNTFQKNAYLERCAEQSETPDVAHLAMYDEWQKEDQRWAEQVHENDLEYDLRSTAWIVAKARASEAYAQNIYAAMCNMQWQRIDVWPVLKNERWSCSWRSAGGIVADLRGEGDYIDWYCSGMGGLNQEYDSKETAEQWSKRTGFVPEGMVTDEIREDFQRLGWAPVAWPDDE